MSNVSVSTWTVESLRRVLEQYEPDAPVLIRWADGQHFIDIVEERDGRVVLGADWAGRIADNPVTTP